MQEFKGDRKLTTVVVKDIKTGEVMEMNPIGVFVFIGLQPNTDFVKDAVDLDAQGFAKTSATVETNIPGVFATGDVRTGSTKQIASVVGEGATAALMVGHYLETQPAAGVTEATRGKHVRRDGKGRQPGQQILRRRVRAIGAVRRDRPSAGNRP